MKISNLNIPKPKYQIGQKVFVNSKDGITEKEVRKIFIDISNYGVEISYYFEDYDRYAESQVFLRKEVKARVEKNLQQLNLFELGKE